MKTELKTTIEKINEKHIQKYKGKIVAIDIETGDYFIRDSELDAYQKAIKNTPIKNLSLNE